jgi:hypothetical protein
MAHPRRQVLYARWNQLCSPVQPQHRPFRCVSAWFPRVRVRVVQHGGAAPVLGLHRHFRPPPFLPDYPPVPPVPRNFDRSAAWEGHSAPADGAVSSTCAACQALLALYRSTLFVKYEQGADSMKHTQGVLHLECQWIFSLAMSSKNLSRACGTMTDAKVVESLHFSDSGCHMGLARVALQGLSIVHQTIHSILMHG